MVRRSWSVAIFAISIISSAFAAYTLLETRNAHASVQKVAQDQLISQPSTWIPFSADVVVTHADGRETAYGTYYRDSHGCSRLETGALGETRIVSLINVPDVTYFWWNKARGDRWTAGPMALSAEGWKPIPRRETVVGLRRHPTFVEVRRGRKGNLRATEGMIAYSYVNITGTLSLQLPELNFFDVLKQTLEGRREAYSNIDIGDQPEELFQPPPGASILRTQRPGGIVVQPLEKSAEHAQHMMRNVTP